MSSVQLFSTEDKANISVLYTTTVIIWMCWTLSWRAGPRVSKACLRLGLTLTRVLGWRYPRVATNVMMTLLIVDNDTLEKIIEILIQTI